MGNVRARRVRGASDDASAQHHLPFHADQSSVSVTLALNDGFEGGGTTFSAPVGVTARPETGHAVAFRGESQARWGAGHRGDEVHSCRVPLHRVDLRTRRRWKRIDEQSHERTRKGISVKRTTDGHVARSPPCRGAARVGATYPSARRDVACGISRTRGARVGDAARRRRVERAVPPRARLASPRRDDAHRLGGRDRDVVRRRPRDARLDGPPRHGRSRGRRGRGLPRAHSPADDDRAHFRESPSVAFWNAWRFDESDGARGVRSLLEQITAATKTPFDARYWAYHIFRSSWFLGQGAAGLLASAAVGTGGRWATPSRRRRRPRGRRRRLLRRSRREVYAQDLAHVNAGTYRAPYDMTELRHRQYDPMFVAKKTARFISEASSTLRKNTRARTDPGR